MRGLTDGGVAVLGSVRLVLELGARNACVEVLVLEGIIFPLLLGMDALLALGITIDCSAREIACGDQRWNFATTDATMTEILQAVVTDDIEPESWEDEGWSEEDLVASRRTEQAEVPSPKGTYALEAKMQQLRDVLQTTAMRSEANDGEEPLDATQLEQLRGILMDTVVSIAWDPSTKRLPAATVEPVKLTLKPEAKTFYMPRRMMSPAAEKFKASMEKELMEAGVVERASSPYCSAVHVARKKGPDLFRYCVDLRALNKQLDYSRYPLPTCQELIDKLAGSDWFSTIDLKSAYWQIEVEEESKRLLAFESVEHGMLQFTRLPMGVLVSSFEFQQRIEEVLRGMVGRNVLVYQDDVIVHGKSWSEHMEVLRETLRRLSRANMTVNLTKCFFCRRSVTYLGFRISGAGLGPDHALSKKIMDFNGPLSYEQTRSFLGTTVLYRRFLYRYAEGEFYVVLYDSIAFLKQQRGWHTTEKETYAVVHYLIKYEHYLDNELPVTVYTDHSAVSGVLEKPNAKRKVMRWALALAYYVQQLRIRHWPGHAMPADFLSRHPKFLDNTTACAEFKWVLLPVNYDKAETTTGHIAVLNGEGYKALAWAALQQECDEVGSLYKAVKDNKEPQEADAKSWWRSGRCWIDEREWLRHRTERGDVIVVPVGMRAMLMQSYHDSTEGIIVRRTGCATP